MWDCSHRFLRDIHSRSACDAARFGTVAFVIGFSSISQRYVILIMATRSISVFPLVYNLRGGPPRWTFHPPRSEFEEFTASRCQFFPQKIPHAQNSPQPRRAQYYSLITTGDPPKKPLGRTELNPLTSSELKLHSLETYVYVLGQYDWQIVAQISCLHFVCLLMFTMHKKTN